MRQLKKYTNTNIKRKRYDIIERWEPYVYINLGLSIKLARRYNMPRAYFVLLDGKFQSYTVALKYDCTHMSFQFSDTVWLCITAPSMDYIPATAMSLRCDRSYGFL